MATVRWPEPDPAEEMHLTASDRKVVDEILKQVTEAATKANKAAEIGRDLSISLIGRANGSPVDPNGGRIGWLEREVRTLIRWRNFMMTSILTASCGVAIYFLKQYLERHP